MCGKRAMVAHLGCALCLKRVMTLHLKISSLQKRVMTAVLVELKIKNYYAIFLWDLKMIALGVWKAVLNQTWLLVIWLHIPSSESSLTTCRTFLALFERLTGEGSGDLTAARPTPSLPIRAIFIPAGRSLEESSSSSSPLQNKCVFNKLTIQACISRSWGSPAIFARYT